MRIFDFENEYKKLLTPTIVDYLSQIHEFKGIQTGMNLQEEMLSELVEIAKIQVRKHPTELRVLSQPMID